MDRFAGGMIARGPTLGADRQSWTGSIHIVDLPNADAARAFADEEPYNRSGVYAEHSIWRFDDLLGQTMWEFEGTTGEPRFIAIASAAGASDPDLDMLPIPGIERIPRERLIVHGALSDAGTGRPAGVAVALEAPSRDWVGALLDSAESGRGAGSCVEVLDWDFGGRR